MTQLIIKAIPEIDYKDKYISPSTIKFEKNTLHAIKEHCEEHNLDTHSMLVYYKDNNIHMSFNEVKGTFKHEIKLNDNQWEPVHA